MRETEREEKNEINSCWQKSKVSKGGRGSEEGESDLHNFGHGERVRKKKVSDTKICVKWIHRKKREKGEEKEEKEKEKRKRRRIRGKKRGRAVDTRLRGR